MLEVIANYHIMESINFFITDNAPNNSTAVGKLHENVAIKTSKVRLQCAAHIINLFIKPILYSMDTNSINQVIEDADQDDGDEDNE